MNLQNLLDTEEIKKLKSRYFRLMDTKRWDLARDLFTEDVEMSVTPAPGEDLWSMKGRDQYVDTVSELLADAVTVHHGHDPEITFTGENTATGVWAMHDIVETPNSIMEGWGHYHEEYRREEDGAWRIAKSHITRLRGYRTRR